MLLFEKKKPHQSLKLNGWTKLDIKKLDCARLKRRIWVDTTVWIRIIICLFQIYKLEYIFNIFVFKFFLCNFWLHIYRVPIKKSQFAHLYDNSRKTLSYKMNFKSMIFFSKFALYDHSDFTKYLINTIIAQ